MDSEEMRKQKTAAIFFGIKKPYDKVNREKTLKQPNTRDE